MVPPFSHAVVKASSTFLSRILSCKGFLKGKKKIGLGKPECFQNEQLFNLVRIKALPNFGADTICLGTFTPKNRPGKVRKVFQHVSAIFL